MTEYERIEKIIHYLDAHYLEQPSLKKLAKISGLSESHFHRLFARWAGTTPKSFLKFVTAKHAKELLLCSRDVLSASLESGLSGPGRLHDLMISVEAMTPGEFKSQGEGMEIRYGFHPSPFGVSLIANTKRGICFLSFTEKGGKPGQKRSIAQLRKKWPKASLIADQRKTASLMRQIFKNKPGGHISVLLKGSSFQLKVWEALLRVPPGHVLSYADIAKAVGRPRAARAVGTALSKNQLAYLIPCHRVIRETGILGEYRWGQIRKRVLLGWEQKKASPVDDSRRLSNDISIL